MPERGSVDKSKYELITDTQSLEKWCDMVNDNGVVAIDCETNSLNAIEAEIVGFSMSMEDSKACYIPLNHKSKAFNQIDEKSFVELSRRILEDSSILKIGQNIKFDFIVLQNIGIKLSNMDDTMLMSYVLRTGFRGHNLDELSLDYLSYKTQKFSEVATIEKKRFPLIM